MADITKVGAYTVLAGGSAKPFWPLVQYTGVKSAMPPAQVAPSAQGASPSTNTVVAPPVFAIFDIVIKMSGDPVVQQVISEADSTDKLLRTVSGTPVETSMPLVLDQDGNIHICFAIPPNKGDLTLNQAAAGSFEGTLRLEAKYNPGAHTVTLELPLKVAKLTAADDMFIFFVVHKKPPKKYCWTKIRAVQASDPAKGVSSQEFRLKLLRDNFQSGYKSINRRVELTTNADGWVSCQILPIFSLFTEGRPVLGLPTDWPLIFNSDENRGRFSSLYYLPRGHMIKLKAANIKDNLQPFECHSIRLTKFETVDLSTKSVLLDAGHGVVYAYASNRRSQEWFVAHLLLDRIATILTEEFNMPRGHIHRTRTAGFGLISPLEIKLDNAPELGDPRYALDMVQQKIRTKQNSHGLKDISDLLLTRHDGTGAALDVSENDRSRLLLINSTAINAIVQRINAHHLGQHQRVQLHADGTNSVRWDEDSGPNSDGDYVFTLERIHPAPGQDPIVDNTAHFPITTADWFNVDDAMMRVLAERSARWSLAKEIGAGPPADAATGRPKFVDAVRQTLIAHNAFNYMVDKILYYLGPVTALGSASAIGDQQIQIPVPVDAGTQLTIDVAPNVEQVTVSKVSDSAPFVLDLAAKLSHPHTAGARVKVNPPQAYLAHGTMAWHVQPRVDFMNSLQGTCDLFITLHENAMYDSSNPNQTLDAVGGAVLVKTAQSPPQNQFRRGKVFLKYLDAFDLGLRQGGIADNVAGLLNSTNSVRENYSYFELEFMDCPSVDNLGNLDQAQYRYQQMVESDFIDRVARQIVCGIAEILTDVQPDADMDAVTYNGQWSLW
jgi:hypothetical protein